MRYDIRESVMVFLGFWEIFLNVYRGWEKGNRSSTNMEFRRTGGIRPYPQPMPRLQPTAYTQDLKPLMKTNTKTKTSALIQYPRIGIGRPKKCTVSW